TEGHTWAPDDDHLERWWLRREVVRTIGGRLGRRSARRQGCVARCAGMARHCGGGSLGRHWRVVGIIASRKTRDRPWSSSDGSGSLTATTTTTERHDGPRDEDE